MATKNFSNQNPCTQKLLSLKTKEKIREDREKYNLLADFSL
jgi:hypothetical protein